MGPIELSDREYAAVQAFIFDEAGISLSAAKKTLVTGRLDKRLRHHRLSSYTAYLGLLDSGEAQLERQVAVDLLTTNETYFFREPRHFELLRDLALQARAEGRPMRVWSAACSSGEEVYSIAMVLADAQNGLGWEVLGSDISARVLDRARTGHYATARVEGIPPAYLRRYCLRGTGSQSGTLLVKRELRERVRFAQLNLNQSLPSLGPFDLIFLRNVMIYFNASTKREVVARMLPALASGGHLLVGHSESLNDLRLPLAAVAPSIYRRA